jgi:hypothetical protein
MILEQFLHKFDKFNKFIWMLTRVKKTKNKNNLVHEKKKKNLNHRYIIKICYSSPRRCVKSFLEKMKTRILYYI